MIVIDIYIVYRHDGSLILLGLRNVGIDGRKRFYCNRDLLTISYTIERSIVKHNMIKSHFEIALVC